jgi:hypothetical protein
MSFWVIFLAVSAALLVHTILAWSAEFLIAQYLQKKQARLIAEFQQKIDSGELNPLDFVNGTPGSGGAGLPPFPLPRPSTTVSGGTLTEHREHGQYL